MYLRCTALRPDRDVIHCPPLAPGLESLQSWGRLDVQGKRCPNSGPLVEKRAATKRNIKIDPGRVAGPGPDIHVSCLLYVGEQPLVVIKRQPIFKHVENLSNLILG